MKANEKLFVTEVTINSLNDPVDFKVTIDSGYNFITGIAITADQNATLTELYETVLASDLIIGQRAVFPENMGARSLYTGNEVCPHERFWCLEECTTAGDQIRGKLVNRVSVASPYTLKVLVKAEKR